VSHGFGISLRNIIPLIGKGEKSGRFEGKVALVLGSLSATEEKG